jgi:hypothetical protein
MSNRLPVLAHEIRNELDEMRPHQKQAVQHAMGAGDRLIEAKKALEHGQWLPWLQETARG